MGETDWGGIWVLFWWAGPDSVNLSSNVLLMVGAVFPHCCLTWVMKVIATSFKRFHAALDPGLHQRLLDTHGQVWVSLLRGHCSFLLGPGTHKVLFVPSKSLFCQSCVYSGGSMVGLMETSSKRAYAIPRSAAPRAPCPWGSPVLTCTSIGDAQTLKGRSGSVPVGTPGGHKVMFEPSEHLWWVWGLILNVILPLLPSGWGLSFALECIGFW